MKRTRFFNRITAAALSLLLVFFCAVTICGAEKRRAPTLYINDEVWFKDSRLPLVIEDGQYYVPAILFLQFDSSEYRKSDTLRAEIITRGNYAFSFDTAGNTIIGEPDVTIVSFLRDGERYLPLSLVCNALGLRYNGYSYVGDETYEAVRITDGKQSLSFDIVRSIFDPTYGDSPSDLPAKNAELPKVYIRLCVITDRAAGVSALLEKLRENKITATFFLTEEFVSENMTTVAEILAGSHSIGFVQGASDAAEASASADAQNNALYSAFHIKTRLIYTENAALSASALVDHGYNLAGNSMVYSSADLQSSKDELTVRMLTVKHITAVIRSSDNAAANSIIQTITENNYPTPTVPDGAPD